MEKSQLAFGKILSYRKYELFMERYRSAAEDFINPHVKALKKNQSQVRVLDVGSGEGYLKYFLEDKDISLDGIEFQPDRIKVCQNLGYKIWSFNIEKDPFPFEDESYDIVVASHVIEHLYNPQPAMKEIHRILKPGGLAVIGVPMHLHWISKILYVIEKFFPNEPLGHHQFYSMRTLKELLKDFKILDIRGFRLLSSRRKFSWEDNVKFYKFNTGWGKKFPSLTPEINAVVKKISLFIATISQSMEYLIVMV